METGKREYQKGEDEKGRQEGFLIVHQGYQFTLITPADLIYFRENPKEKSMDFIPV